MQPTMLQQADLDPLLRQCEVARARLAGDLSNGGLSAFALARQSDDLGELRAVAADWRKRFKRVVLFGTGGSSLGARALAALATGPNHGGPELCVPDNLDPDLMAQVLAPDQLAHTGFLVVSKSGGTGETLAQALTAVSAVRAALGPDAPAEHFLGISEPGNGALRQLCATINAPVLDHDPDVGGRFAVLSLVGLLPAMIVGLDAEAVRAGARTVLDAAMNNADSAPAMGAAMQVALQRQGLGQSVLLAYGEAFKPFVLWYRQLWAESLGKNGLGTTPIRALGTVDQHSQLQLYLDGPGGMMFTLITGPAKGVGGMIDAKLATEAGLGYLAGHRMGDLLDAEQRATAAALTQYKRPVRIISLERLDEAAMGALMMHFMIETVIAAHLLGVNAFDQPAVEAGKVLARRTLEEDRP